MAEILNLHCSQGHPGERVCTAMGCSHPCIICPALLCKCRTPHYRCNKSIPISQISRLFYQKSKKGYEIIDKLIVFCDRAAKLIHIKRCELQRLRDTKYYSLEAKEEEVYGLFKDGRTQEYCELDGDEMGTIMKTLKLPKQNLSNFYASIEDVCKRSEEILNKVMGDMEEVLDGEEKNVFLPTSPEMFLANQKRKVETFRFYTTFQLKSKDVNEVMGESQIRLMTKDPDRNLVMLTPSIMEADHPLRVNVLVNRAVGLSFGIYQHDQKTPTNFKMKNLFSEGKGLHLVDSNGIVFSPASQTTRAKQTQHLTFMFSSGDRLILQYDKQTSTVKIINTSRIAGVCKIKVEMIKNLVPYFCVCLSNTAQTQQFPETTIFNR